MSSPSTGTVTDVSGRRLRDLRISVTDRCNFRCVYCTGLKGAEIAYILNNCEAKVLVTEQKFLDEIASIRAGRKAAPLRRSAASHCCARTWKSWSACSLR